MKGSISKEAFAERSIRSLTEAGDLKKLPAQEAIQIASFYEARSLNRLQTAKLVYEASAKEGKRITDLYSDYSEAVSAAYYAMFYIVHAYLATLYKTKLREGVRGVHAITHHIVLYYLVKTKQLAQHLYEEYLATLETTSSIQNITLEDFQPRAQQIAKEYDKTRHAREIFTYNTSPSIEAHHAERAIKTAEEFINTVRQVMRKNR